MPPAVPSFSSTPSHRRGLGQVVGIDVAVSCAKLLDVGGKDR